MDTRFKIYLKLIVTILFVNRCHGLDTSTVKPTSDLFSKRSDSLQNKYDPPAEFYRGPGSSSSSSFSERDRNRDRNPESNVIGLQRPYSFETRLPPKGGGSGSSNSIDRKGVGISHDRIGHYGPSVSNEYSNGYGDHSSYGYPQPIDFQSNYGPTGHAIYETGLDYDKGYGEYYGPPQHPPSDYYSDKIKFTKSFLIPLAGAAIIGLAAALISNPLLLQLGTVSGALGKRRKRRDLNGNNGENAYESYAHRMAYKGYVDNKN